MSRRKQREEGSRNLGDIVLWFFHSAAYSDLREQLNLYKDLLFIPLAAYKTQKHQKHHKAQKHHHSLITLF